VFVRGQEASLFVLTNDNKYFVVSLPASTKALLGPLSLSLPRWKISLSAIWKNGKKWKP
jgi:hypothetical protein